MGRRMGTEVNSSWALQYVHIKFINDQLETAYQGAQTDGLRQEIATAGTANLVLWLGLLRGGETFSLKREDVTVVPPAEGPQHGLPAGLGYVELRLLPETKSSPHKVADVVIAYPCSSGLSLGRWME